MSTLVQTVSERTTRRIARRLAPFLFLLYVLSYIDRVNISNAALQMTADLKFSNAVFGLGAGIFFIGYFLFQIPQTLLVESWSARKYIGLSLVVWGVLATGTGFVTNAHQFYWIRFLLGVAEAGFFPGVIVYLTHWYRSKDRAKAVAMFMLAIPASNLIGAALAAFLIKLHWLGYSGWRWMLILEGLPAVIAGFTSFGYLTDRPKDAQWLQEDEREWITSELEREKTARGERKTTNVLRALLHPQVLLLALAYFFYITNSTGLGIWLPKIVQRMSGLSLSKVILISGIPWLAAIPAMLLSSWHSDKSGERKWHSGLAILFAGFALAMTLWAGNHVFAAMSLFCVATMALYSFPSPFWTLPNDFLSGAAAAASIALINSAGNLGGFVGPYVIGFLTDRTGTFAAGICYLIISAVLGAVIVLSLRPVRGAVADALGPGVANRTPLSDSR